MKSISIASPVFAGREKEYVLKCMDSTRISSSGEFIDAFEEKFASFCGVKHALTCNNGTSALHLALAAMGVRPGDEVIVPALTYVATANAVVYCGGTPVFADVEESTGNIDPHDLARVLTSRTKGIVVVHLYGHPANMDPIMQFARRHNLFVIEDAAEAHGALYKGKKIGSIGDAATFSFYGNKLISCGEGGAVVTDDDRLASVIRQLRGQGVDAEKRYWHSVIGYNYRMPNLIAAVALAQLEQIDWHQMRRQEVAALYTKCLAGAADLVIRPSVESWAHHVYWMYTIRLHTSLASRRDELMSLLAADGIETRPAFYSLHQLPPYKSDGSDLVRSEQWAASGISLPTHAALSEDDVEYVCARVIFHLTNFGNRSVGACSDQSMHASTLQLPEQASTARLPEQASTARLPDQAVESVEKITGKKYAEVISCQ
jgi:perosamine synthetase